MRIHIPFLRVKQVIYTDHDQVYKKMNETNMSMSINKS